MKKYLLLFLLMSPSMFFCQEQVSANIEQIIPPNVDAVSVFKSSETVPNLSNGMIDVTIPIYNITLRELSIPINLKYYSRGIKVSEIASSVGLGWSFNYGGLVSRQVRDKADDEGSFGYLFNNQYKNILSQEIFDVRNLYNTHNTHDNLDLVPDRFFFNIGAISGEFIFDQVTGDILQQNLTDIKIKAKFSKENKIIGWEIIDTNGNKYFFGIFNDSDVPIASSKAFQNYVAYNPLIKYEKLDKSTSEYYDSWYLLRIETYYNEVIEYEYGIEKNIYYSKNYDKKISKTNEYQFETFFSKISEQGFYLKKIIHPLGYIEIEKDSEKRRDIISSLGSIKKIKNYSFRDKLLETYIFDYKNIFNNDLKNLYSLLPDLDETSMYRMFLEKIKKIDVDNNNIGQFLFEYNQQLLPNRFSNSKDIWGYYNGKDNGTVWEITSKNIDNGVYGKFSEAGLLRSIEYPTGKKEIYTFEDNTVINNYYGLTQTFNEFRPKVKKSLGFSKKPLAAYDDRNNCQDINDCKDLIGPLVIDFELPEDISNAYYIYFENKLVSADLGAIKCKYSVALYKEGKFIDPHTGFESPYAVGFYPSNRGKLNIGAGKYTLVVNGPSYCNYEMRRFASWALSFEWEETSNIYTEKIVLGEGKRIKRIDTYSNNELQKSQEFDYITEDGKNSGLLYGTPPYLQKLKTINGIDMYVPFGLEDSSPLSSFRDSGLGYSNVVEYISSKNETKIGKRNYSFTSFVNEGGGYYEWPFYLSINNEWRRGLLLSLKDYSFDKGIYKLQREEKNTYEYQIPGTPVYDSYVRNSLIPAPGTILPPFYSKDFYKNDRNGYRIPLIRFYRNYYDNEIDSRFSLYSNQRVFYKRYYLTGGRYSLTKREEIDYNNEQIIKKTITNSYESKKHFLLTSENIEDNLKNNVINNFVLVNDVQGSNATLLKNANRIAPILQHKMFKNGEELMSKENVYKNWGNNLIDVEEIKQTKGGENVDVSSKILFRDNRNGNILELMKGRTKEVYLYGYNSSFMIAKIENASKEEVAAALGVMVADLVNIDESKLAQLDGLRSNPKLKESLITTYEHKPLVGVTKITDSKGISLYYEYDSANRLKIIKDTEGNILKSYEYNYKNN